LVSTFRKSTAKTNLLEKGCAKKDTHAKARVKNTFSKKAYKTTFFQESSLNNIYAFFSIKQNF
jgi:hypothetical protein